MLLEAADLSFAFSRRAGAPPVINEVSLSLAAGEVVGIVGPNGAGKSTLLRLLLGQLSPRAGVVRWEDRPLGNWRRRALARRVAYLSQAPSWEPSQRVEETLRMGRTPFLGAFGVESSFDLQVVERVAGHLGLTDLLKRRLAELSGGQRQRVFLGRCLVQEPVALLLDEPTTHLDLKHQMQLTQSLRHLARDQHLGILATLHDLNLAGVMCDRVVLLSEGRVAAQGLPGEVLRPQVLEPVYGLRFMSIAPDARQGMVFPLLDDSPAAPAQGRSTIQS